MEDGKLYLIAAYSVGLTKTISARPNQYYLFSINGKNWECEVSVEQLFEALKPYLKETEL